MIWIINESESQSTYIIILSMCLSLDESYSNIHYWNRSITKMFTYKKLFYPWYSDILLKSLSKLYNISCVSIPDLIFFKTKVLLLIPFYIIWNYIITKTLGTSKMKSTILTTPSNDQNKIQNFHCLKNYTRTMSMSGLLYPHIYSQITDVKC